MTTESTPEQGKLSLTSNHRLSSLGNEATPSHLHDCVTTMCSRAESVLLLISYQFEGLSNKWSDDVNWNALESAINEIRDIQEVVESYYNANKPAPVQGGVE
jgi:hypothetical protein